MKTTMNATTAAITAAANTTTAATTAAPATTALVKLYGRTMSEWADAEAMSAQRVAEAVQTFAADPSDANKAALAAANKEAKAAGLHLHLCRALSAPCPLAWLAKNLHYSHTAGTVSFKDGLTMKVARRTAVFAFNKDTYALLIPSEIGVEIDTLRRHATGEVYASVSGKITLSNKERDRRASSVLSAFCGEDAKMNRAEVRAFEQEACRLKVNTLTAAHLSNCATVLLYIAHRRITGAEIELRIPET